MRRSIYLVSQRNEAPWVSKRIFPTDSRAIKQLGTHLTVEAIQKLMGRRLCPEVGIETNASLKTECKWALANVFPYK